MVTWTMDPSLAQHSPYKHCIIICLWTQICLQELFSLSNRQHPSCHMTACSSSPTPPCLLCITALSLQCENFEWFFDCAHSNPVDVRLCHGACYLWDSIYQAFGYVLQSSEQWHVAKIRGILLLKPVAASVNELVQPFLWFVHCWNWKKGSMSGKSSSMRSERAG